MIFHSTLLPGARMNRYGVVFLATRVATPDERGAVLREAVAAGCVRVPHPDRDLGLVWTNPQPTVNPQSSIVNR